MFFPVIKTFFVPVLLNSLNDTILDNTLIVRNNKTSRYLVDSEAIFHVGQVYQSVYLYATRFSMPA